MIEIIKWIFRFLYALFFFRDFELIQFIRYVTSIDNEVEDTDSF